MKRAELDTYPVAYVEGLLARVAELEALVREAEESNANALADLASAAEARIELRRLENEAVRRQLGHAENVCDAMENRIAELEARCKRLEEAVESLLPYAEATNDESSEWAPGRWKSEKLKRIIDEARKAKEAKP